jgi:predicted nucleic acid-binding protein
MIGLDSNIIISAFAAKSDHHQVVMDWLNVNEEPLGVPNSAIAETLRVVTHPRFYSRPTTLVKAMKALSHLFADYSIAALGERDTWIDELGELASLDVSLRGNLIFDARICLCLRYHNIKKCLSLDSDLDRFPFISRITPA